MDTFIEQKVRSCERCIKRKTQPSTASLVSISSTSPMEIICIDYLSLERSKGGFEHILVVTDHFTRYAQAFPTKNQTASTTAKVLFDQFFVHYGFPDRIHSDQGANFESHLIKELCNLAGISKSHTTPYHAMGNGLCERFNQTLLKMLGTLPENKKADWKSYVAPLVHAYNVTIHESTGFSPYFIMFGRQPKLALDALLGIHIEENTSKSRNEYVRKLRDKLSLAYNKAKQTADKTAEVNKDKYDIKAKAATLHPGDIVLARNVSLRGKHKIADKWESEPYIVVSQPDQTLPVFQVKKQNPKSRKIKTLHRNLLLPLKSASVTDKNTEEIKSSKYIIPQRRNQETNEEAQSVQLRPQRHRRKPQWQQSDQWVMK
jgi:transposase InsO family protein